MTSNEYLREIPTANDPAYELTSSRGLTAADHRKSLVNSADRLLDQIARLAQRAQQLLPPGALRQWRGIEAYLNACLKRPQIHELADALFDQGGTARVRQHHSRLTSLLGPIEADTGNGHPGKEPQTLAAMVLEAERVEHELGRAAPEYRNALRTYLCIGPRAD